MVLGFVGVVAALGLGVAVWPVAARVDQRTNELSTAAIQHIDEAEPVKLAQPFPSEVGSARKPDVVALVPIDEDCTVIEP